MKIITDVSQILSQRTPAQPIRHNQSPPQEAPLPKQKNLQINQSIREQLNLERSFNDALNIAHTSQALIQKALVVSSRLRSMAEHAMATGKTDTTELHSTLSEIQATMQHYGEGVTSPLLRTGDGNEIPSYPQATKEIQQVVTTANHFEQGTVPNPITLNNLEQNLSQKLGATNSAVEALQDRIQNIVQSYPEQQSFNAKHSIPITADLITGNPNNALNAQGNLSRESVGRVLGT